MAGETVLIIDDSTELRSVLETVLPYGGFDVLSAKNGEEGLKLATEARPDLIMVDLELPDTNGLKVLEALKERGVTIPTIMMTGYGSEGVAARALRLGVRDYLIKPFTTEEVLSSVERALTESRLRQENVRLEALVSKNTRHLKLIFAIGRSLANGTDLQELLQRIIGGGLFITRAEAGFLLLGDEHSDRLQMVAAENSALPVGKTVPPFAGDERLGSVLREGVAVRLGAADIPNVELQTTERVWAVLLVPLKGRSGVRGLLSMDRRTSDTPFTIHDEQILMILADYALIALGELGLQSGKEILQHQVQRMHA